MIRLEHRYTEGKSSITDSVVLVCFIVDLDLRGPAVETDGRCVVSGDVAAFLVPLPDRFRVPPYSHRETEEPVILLVCVRGRITHGVRLVLVWGFILRSLSLIFACFLA